VYDFWAFSLLLDGSQYVDSERLLFNHRAYLAYSSLASASNVSDETFVFE